MLFPKRVFNVGIAADMAIMQGSVELIMEGRKVERRLEKERVRPRDIRKGGSMSKEEEKGEKEKGERARGKAKGMLDIWVYGITIQLAAGIRVCVGIVDKLDINQASVRHRLGKWRGRRGSGRY